MHAPPQSTMEGPIAATESDSGESLDDGSLDDASVVVAVGVADAASADVDVDADVGAPDGSFACGELTCAASDACMLKRGTSYACMPMNGCTLGCGCLNIVLGCLGGSCAKEDGHLVVQCP